MAYELAYTIFAKFKSGIVKWEMKYQQLLNTRISHLRTPSPLLDHDCYDLSILLTLLEIQDLLIAGFTSFLFFLVNME
jgi:hypothetical protein